MKIFQILKNKPEIFGDQVIVDEDENIIKFEEKMLLKFHKPLNKRVK